MALSITQQAALLFKKLFGKAQTTTARDFFEEPFNAPPTVLTSQIWTDSAQIPLTASVSFTGSGHIIGVVQYLEDIPLTLVAGTSSSFQDNQLRDAIPFNYGNGSYNYAIKDSTSTAIPFGTSDWIVDTEGGVLSFYSSVPANMPPTITFYKYVGNKGLASASVNLANSASYAVTASYASNAGATNFSTGSYTGSFTGSLLGSASYALMSLSSSAATSITFLPASSSYALSSSWAAQVISASFAGTSWGVINNKPTVISSSAQINTGSFTGSFTGSLLGSASYAGTDWNAINNKPTVFSSSVQINTGSYTGSFTGSLLGSASYALTASAATSITFTPASSSYALSSSFARSSSFAVSASWAPGSAGGDFNTLVNKPTLVSSSAQVNTGSFTGSFTGGFAGTASYALNAATASYISSSVDFPNGLTVTGSITASVGFSGSGANITGVVSSSYALTASYAMNGGGSGVSSSYALTSSYASYAPTALSASFATSALTASYMTGSINFTDGLLVTGSVTASVGYTGSFTGSLLGSASYALTSSAATSITFVPLTASYALSAGATGGGLTGDGAAGFVTVFNGTTSVTASIIQADNSRVTMNVPLTASFFQGTGSAIVGVISASYATTAATASYISGGLDLSNGLIVTGSVTASIGYTGSFTGSLLGSSSYALSSSYAMSASWAPGGGAADFNTLLNKPTLVSSSAQVNTGSFTGSFTGGLLGTSSWAQNAISSSYALSSSYAGTDWNAVNNKPTIFSSSAQINTGSYTGSFTGSLLGSSSYALSSSWAARSISASYAGTDWNAINNKPTVFSSSVQINTGSYTGSLTGSLLGSASYAPTSWVDINNKPVGILSGSTQINLLSGVSSSWASQSFSSSYSVSSSYAVSASWAPGSAGGDFNTLVNKPTLVSSSAQVNTGSFTGSFTGNLLGSASYALTSSYASVAQSVLGSITSASYAQFATSASYFTGSLTFPAGLIVTGSVTASAYTGSFTGSLLGSASYALSASWAPGGGAADFNTLLNKPTLVSSSAQVNTGSFTGSFIGDHVGSSSWASQSISSSYARSASYAGTDWNAINNKPVIISASAQINTGSFTGSFTGGFAGTASYAFTSWADVNNKPLGILSSSAQINLLTNVSASWASRSISASYAGTDWNAINNRPVVVSSSAQVSTGSYTGSFTGGLLGSASYAPTSWADVNNKPTGILSGSTQINLLSGVSSSWASQSLSSSYAFSSSYAVSASWAPVSAGSDFNTLVNKPTLVSSSAQVNTGSFTGSFTGGLLGTASYATTAATASYISGGLYISNGLDVIGSITASIGYTGSFTGSLLGSASYALSSSYAMSASWAPTSAGGDFNTLVNKPTLVSSSAQVNTGSFTGSFTGSLLGSASYALSSSYASVAQSVLGSITSASYAATASSATTFFVRGDLNSFGVSGDPTNTVIGSGALTSYTITLPNNSRNTAVGYQALTNNVSGTDNVAVGYQALTNNVSGTGNVAIGNYAQYNTIRSANNVSIGISANQNNISAAHTVAIGTYALQSNNASYNVAVGASSLGANISGSDNVAVGSHASNINVSGSYNVAIGRSTLVSNVSGNNNIAIGNSAGTYETGSNAFWVDAINRNSLFAAQTSSLLYGVMDNVPSQQTLRINANVSMSQNVLAMQGVTGSLQGSSSYALSASWAPGGGAADFNTLLNKPTLVSSSAQVNSGSFTGSFIGSASYATMALTASYMTGSLNFSDGLVVTGSVTASIGYTGSFTGSLLGSSSYALSSSWAPPVASVSASYATYAVSASYITGTISFPNGLVVTGSVTASAYTGSFTGSLLGSASYALSASWAPSVASVSASYATYAVSASYISGGLDLSSGLVVTGSVSASQGFSGSLAGTASYANTASALVSRHTDVFTTPSIGTNVTYTGSIDLGRTWMLLGIEADRAARVRMYATTGSRFTDGLRAIGTDPSASAGVLADFVFTAAGKLMVTPVIVGSNMEGTVSSSTPFLIENRSGGASTVAITFTNIKVE